LVSKTSLDLALGLLLFMAGFFLYLFLTFQDKIVVFVTATKPVVHLSDRGLSGKESSHLLGLLAGKSMKEIAWDNKVKESTIRNSLSRAYHRLGFTDKTQLLKWAENYDIRP
jgi:DNA-binding NarL/FixJ family response regulator